MKRFKQYLEEAGAGYVSTDHYDVYELVFNYGMIGSGYPLFPFYGKRQERIQGKLHCSSCGYNRPTTGR